MRKIIVAKKTGKNTWKAHKEYTFEKGEIVMFLFGLIMVGYVAVRVLIG
ncbi:hypothetical protein [Treponema succinifaciens]